MATKNLFAQMLNEKPAQSPQVKNSQVRLNKPVGVKNFAYLGGNSAKPAMSKFDPDLSSSVWARAKTFKSKGPK